MNTEKSAYLEVSTGGIFPVGVRSFFPRLSTPQIVENAVAIRSGLRGIIPEDHFSISYHPGAISDVHTAVRLFQEHNLAITSVDSANIETNRMMIDKWIRHIGDLHGDELRSFMNEYPSTQLAERIDSFAGVIYDRQTAQQALYLDTLRAGFVEMLKHKKKDVYTMFLDAGWRVMNKDSMDHMFGDFNAVFAAPKPPHVLRIGADSFHQSTHEGEEVLRFVKRLGDPNFVVLIEIDADRSSHTEHRRLIDRIRNQHTDLHIGYEFDLAHEARALFLHPSESSGQTLYSNLQAISKEEYYVGYTINQWIQGEGQTHFDPTVKNGFVDFGLAGHIIGKAANGRPLTKTGTFPFGRIFLLELKPTVTMPYVVKRGEPNSLDTIFATYNEETAG